MSLKVFWGLSLGGGWNQKFWYEILAKYGDDYENFKMKTSKFQKNELKGLVQTLGPSNKPPPQNDPCLKISSKA
jgi:hypothetical protein